MNTFEIKLSILSILGEKAEKRLAEELYQWVMEEVEVENKDSEVVSLKTVQ